MYTLEELKNDIYNDLNDKRKPIYIKRNTIVLMYVVSVPDIKDIIDERLDEYFNQILPGEKMSKILYSCELYPCTVVYDRYGGCYSGGQYTAWHCDPWDVPEEIDCDDVTCGWFWMRKEEISIPYGIGNTPDEAVLNLAKKMNIKEE